MGDRTDGCRRWDRSLNPILIRASLPAMLEALLTLIAIPLVAAWDSLVLPALLRPCYKAALAIERKLYAIGLRRAAPVGRSGIVAFVALVMAIPGLIVVWGRLSGRLPP